MPRGDGAFVAGSEFGADGAVVVVVLDAPVSGRGATVPAGMLGRGERSAVVVDGRADGGTAGREAGALVGPGSLALGAPTLGAAGVGGAAAVAARHRAP